MSHDNVTRELQDFVTGELSADACEEVTHHLAACGECRDEVQSLDAALGALAAKPFAVSRAKQALEKALAGGARFTHFAAQVAELFDVPEAEAQALFARVDDEQAWLEGPAEGVHIMPVQTGPKKEGAMAALVRLQPGATFPEHEHFGEEHVVVLEGGYRSTGETREVWRGEVDIRNKGTRHAFSAVQGLQCLCASVAWPPND